MSDFETIAWGNKAVVILDQTRLPGEEVYLHCTDYHQVAEAIKKLRVRGAPAIGIAAAMGLALGAANLDANLPRTTFDEQLEEIAQELASTRPTAVNLFWALDRMRKIWKGSHGASTEKITAALLEESRKLRDYDSAINRKIGYWGSQLFRDGWRVLTHCNAGALATAGHGTALGVIRSARAAGMKISVLADETRPLLQGARLTAWELSKDDIPVKVITDGMSASFMARGEVDAVIVGADRIAANGDTANKIGTYGLAVTAQYHQIPFYVAAPLSTFDLSLQSGSSIPIEERDPEEVTVIGGLRIVPEGVPAANPAFDVTPARLISAIITEKGVLFPPYVEAISRLLECRETGRGPRKTSE